MPIPRAGLDQRIIGQLFPRGLETAQALPNQARDDPPQVGAERVLALPLTQDAEVVPPQVDVHLLCEIVDEQLCGRRRGQITARKNVL